MTRCDACRRRNLTDPECAQICSIFPPSQRRLVLRSEDLLLRFVMLKLGLLGTSVPGVG